MDKLERAGGRSPSPPAQKVGKPSGVSRGSRLVGLPVPGLTAATHLPARSRLSFGQKLEVVLLLDMPKSPRAL